jgi:hypothetical protein
VKKRRVLLVILKGEGSFGILVLNWIGVGFGGGNSVVGKLPGWKE